MSGNNIIQFEGNSNIFRIKYPMSAIAQADDRISEVMYYIDNLERAGTVDADIIRAMKHAANKARLAVNSAGNNMDKLRDAAEVAKDELTSQINHVEDNQTRQYCEKQLADVNKALDQSAGLVIE
jgi:hypothetical protein